MRSNSSHGLGRVRDLGTLFLSFCLVVFTSFLWASYQIHEVSSYLLPRGLAIVGILATLVDLGAGYFRPRESVGEEAGEGKGISVFVAIGFTSAYFLLVPLIGFVLATALAVVGFSYLTGFPRKKLAAILAVAIPIALHLTFVELLKAPLPGGFLGALPF